MSPSTSDASSTAHRSESVTNTAANSAAGAGRGLAGRRAPPLPTPLAPPPPHHQAPTLAREPTSPHKRGHPHDAHSPPSNASSPQPGGPDGPEDQRTKRRRTGPGSRGVANLTPEQLAKKRANDREAQRAIRERTKNQIETLEQRIRDLTSQQPYQELQAVIRQKEAVEAENAEIKNRLAAIMALIQPIFLNHQAAGAYASPVPTFAPPAPPPQPPPPPPSSHSAHNVSTPGSATTASPAADTSWRGQGSAQPSPRNTQVSMLNQQRHDLLHTLELGAGEQLKLDFLLDPSQRVNRMQTGVNGPQDTPAYQHLPMKHDWNGASYPPPRSASAMSGASQQQHHQRIDYAPEQGPSLKNGEPTCPLDHLLLDFLHERRQRAAEGVPTQEIVGPRYPSVSSLLNPADSAYSHPLSKVFTDILATFPGICTLPERVAVLYIMFLIMRWQISPTQENYELLPAWARPVSAQLAHAHPAWVDHLPFPEMRAKLAREYSPSAYLFDNFFIPFTSTVSLNWPYEDTDALLQSPAAENGGGQGGGELLINPVFERHLRRLENWTLGDAFDKAFPNLRGTYNLKRDGSVLVTTTSNSSNSNSNSSSNSRDATAAEQQRRGSSDR
ncbi:hypothetical protein GGR56DRAFT_613756 [Xylariaceae sp. FL0804]|nr:hypothetical protein GGR56DRAFT_613756 [Xylariaceae sp. FL0804]